MSSPSTRDIADTSSLPGVGVLTSRADRVPLRIINCGAKRISERERRIGMENWLP
jgi:hypothetical protein